MSIENKLESTELVRPESDEIKPDNKPETTSAQLNKSDSTTSETTQSESGETELDNNTELNAKNLVKLEPGHQIFRTEYDEEDDCKNRVQEIAAAAERAVIYSPETAKKGADFIKIISTYIKKVEIVRKTLVEPLNETVKSINDLFRPFTNSLRTSEKTAKSKLLTYKKVELEKQRRVEEARRKVEEQRLLAKAEQAESEGKKDDADKILNNVVTLESTQTKAAPVRGDYGGVASIRKNWVFELVDIQKLAQAHPDLIEVDAAAIRKEIREGQREIA